MALYSVVMHVVHAVGTFSGTIISVRSTISENETTKRDSPLSHIYSHDSVLDSDHTAVWNHHYYHRKNQNRYHHRSGEIDDGGDDGVVDDAHGPYRALCSLQDPKLTSPG